MTVTLVAPMPTPKASTVEPVWCDGRCQDVAGDLWWQFGRMAHTTDDVKVGSIRTRMTQSGPESAPQVEIDTPKGRFTFSPAESGLLGSALLQFAREGDPK